MKISLLILSLFSLSVMAETKLEEKVKSAAQIYDESRNPDFQIDWKYKAGEYLIYDCERSHYACVNLDGFNNCSEERNFAIEKKSAFYPCAPFKKFADKKSCVEKNYKVVDVGAIKRFCYPK